MLELARHVLGNGHDGRTVPEELSIAFAVGREDPFLVCVVPMKVRNQGNASETATSPDAHSCGTKLGQDDVNARPAESPCKEL